MSNVQVCIMIRRKPLTVVERRAAARNRARLDCQRGRHSATPTFRAGETVCLVCGLVVYCPVCLDENHLVYPSAHAHPLTCSTHRHGENTGTVRSPTGT